MCYSLPKELLSYMHALRAYVWLVAVRSYAGLVYILCQFLLCE